MRVLCHAPHLSGVGHFVRMQAIARGLGAGHDVYLTDGGRPVPRRPSGREPVAIPLPRLVRTSEGLRADQPGASVAATLAARAEHLARAAAEIRPDVVLIDHYPLSKWELEPEMAALIDGARRARPSVRVVCSLRDIVRQTRHEAVGPAEHAARARSILGARFDVLLVHADPAFTRLEEHFAPAGGLPVPVHYTGFVVDPGEPGPAPIPDAPYAVLSCGGGARSLPFLLAAVEAFGQLYRDGAIGSMPLVVFPGPFLGEPDLLVLRRATGEPWLQLRAFTPDFDRWLAGSALSISRAGYNTSVRILHSRVPSVLVPDPDMSDQGPRARRLAERGIAILVEGAPPSAAVIAAGIRAALARGPAAHALDLGGVAATRAILEHLGAQQPAAHPSPARIRAG
ncbi:MAG TPA: glycosyltransferase [Candidatus Binatia bacterium]|nr:glycosyltransferase [Candidatus Binatia bacterium]